MVIKLVLLLNLIMGITTSFIVVWENSVTSATVITRVFVVKSKCFMG